MNLQNFKWDIRFLDLAKLVSTWSKDPSTKIGAVITDRDNKIVSLGYNGFPKKVADDDRLNEQYYLQVDLLMNVLYIPIHLCHARVVLPW